VIQNEIGRVFFRDMQLGIYGNYFFLAE